MLLTLHSRFILVLAGIAVFALATACDSGDDSNISQTSAPRSSAAFPQTADGELAVWAVDFCSEFLRLLSAPQGPGLEVYALLSDMYRDMANGLSQARPPSRVAGFHRAFLSMATAGIEINAKKAKVGWARLRLQEPEAEAQFEARGKVFFAMMDGLSNEVVNSLGSAGCFP